jgi:hypothetical protein
MWQWYNNLLGLLVTYVTGSTPPTGNPMAATNAYFALLVGAPPTAPGPVWTAFAEAGWTGYARQQTSAWSGSVNPDGTPNAVGASCAWNNGGSGPQLVYGVAAVDAVSGAPTNIWGAYTARVPVVVPAGGTVMFIPGYPEGGMVLV